MSLELAQSRVAEITARLAALDPTPPVRSARTPATPAATGATATAPAQHDFPAQLQTALTGGRSALPPAVRDAVSAAVTGAVQAAAGTSASTPVAATAGRPSAAAGAAVVAEARTYLGVPYLWGGTSRRGIDCSGLVQAVYKAQGIDLPRVSRDQARAGREVSPANAQPGDLVALDNSRSRAGVDHIGIYIGNGKWIAAPRTGDVVKVQSIDLDRAVTIRRVLPDRSLSATASTASTSSAGTPRWADALPAAARRHVPALLAAGAATGVDPRLLASVAWAESGFSATARSRAGALGLMQLMPATARGLGVDPLDPVQAALGAAKYLREQLQVQGGRTDLALAAYNAGPGAVRKHGGIPPYAETQKYVVKVLGHYAALGGAA